MSANVPAAGTLEKNRLFPQPPFFHPMSLKPFLHLSAILALAVLPAAAAEQEKPAAPEPAAEAKETKEAPAAPGDKEGDTPAELPPPPPPVDIGGFGSDEPAERPDMPTRGVLTFGPGDYKRMPGAHWETYVWTNFKAPRWGRYQVRLTYTLNAGGLGMQFRLGDLTVKKQLTYAPKLKKTYLGSVYLPKAGEVPFALLTPPSEGLGFEIEEIALIPTCEGAPAAQAEDGSITLQAKDATTWSTNMRFEPKTEKNCLGFWTDPEDFAEWEFSVAKPGRYKVTVVHGCGGGNHGSEVEVKQGEQKLKFTTQDTGGFQKWKEVQVGELEIPKAGTHRLVIDPVNKVKSAVLDVQKVILTPVG